MKFFFRLASALLGIVFITAGLSACDTMNAAATAGLSATASNYAGAKANVQTVEDMKLTALLDGACATTLGALKRYSGDNSNAIKAILLACPVPTTKSTVSTADITSTSTTATTTSE